MTEESEAVVLDDYHLSLPVLWLQCFVPKAAFAVEGT
jgi:hypothetical protein